jgi:hypothetical protein
MLAEMNESFDRDTLVIPSRLGVWKIRQAIAQNPSITLSQ